MPLPSFSALTSAAAWLKRLAESRHALWLLFVASILETLLIPVPIEVILIPWMLAHPHKKWRIASVALAGNLTAALIGFGLGSMAMEQWGGPLIAAFGGQAAYENFQTHFDENGFQAIMLIGIVPVPFQIAMLVAGASDYPLHLFLLASFLARSVRYFGLALLVKFAGGAAMRIWHRHARPVGAVLLLVFAAWLAWQVQSFMS